MKTTNIIIKASRSLCGTGALALLLSASTVQAAVSITGNFVGATAPTINNTYGTLEFALNMGGAPLTRDGIAFTTAGTTPGATQNFLTSGGVGATINVVGVTQGGADWGTVGVGPLGSDPLFQTIAYGNSQTSGYTIGVTGLDAGKSYQLQFLFGDARTAWKYIATVSVSDNLSPTPNTASTSALTYGGSALGDEFAMLTAVVSGSTSFTFTAPRGTGSGSPGISGLVVHSVPEPSAALLGGLGLLALLRRRR